MDILIGDDSTPFDLMDVSQLYFQSIPRTISIVSQFSTLQFRTSIVDLYKGHLNCYLNSI